MCKFLGARRSSKGVEINLISKFIENGYTHHSQSGLTTQIIEEFAQDQEIDYDVYLIDDWGCVIVTCDKYNGDRKIRNWLKSISQNGKVLILAKVFRVGQIEFENSGEVKKLDFSVAE